MEPVLQAPAINPQIIMSLCAVSIVTYNKLSEIMMPFHGGNKIRPHINVTTGNQTFNWLFDTGAAITCMNPNSFQESLGHSKPKLLKKVPAALQQMGQK
jgi:hypothetical protein